MSCWEGCEGGVEETGCSSKAVVEECRNRLAGRTVDTDEEGDAEDVDICWLATLARRYEAVLLLAFVAWVVKALLQHATSDVDGADDAMVQLLVRSCRFSFALFALLFDFRNFRKREQERQRWV